MLLAVMVLRKSPGTGAARDFRLGEARVYRTFTRR
jgi:hypothetical protein